MDQHHPNGSGYGDHLALAFRHFYTMSLDPALWWDCRLDEPGVRTVTFFNGAEAREVPHRCCDSRPWARRISN